MKLGILICTFFIFSIYHSVAQPGKAVPLILALNQKVSAAKQGYFDCYVTSKSLMKDDTFCTSGRTFFFRGFSDKDSIGQFVVDMPFQVRKGYDGELFYFIDGKRQKIRTQPVLERGGVKPFISGGMQDDLGFRNYIFGDVRQPFLSSLFENAIVDTISNSDNILFLITVKDSFPNPLRTTEKDPALGYLKQEYEITYPEYNLLCKREWVTLGARVQYKKQNLSAIYPQPDSFTFKYVLHLDSLLSCGYSLEDSKPALPLPLISKGDTVPLFFLQDLNGNEIDIEKTGKKLILLDFWYKSCGPCLLAMPSIERIHKAYQNQGLGVFGINDHDKDISKLKALLLDREVTYSTLLDPQKTLAKRLNITGYPTVILLDVPSRKVLFAEAGLGENDMLLLKQIIEEHLR